MKCEAAVSSGRMPSALPSAIWFSGWPCLGLGSGLGLGLGLALGLGLGLG